jgi:hypothetical protein
MIERKNNWNYIKKRMDIEIWAKKNILQMFVFEKILNKERASL